MTISTKPRPAEALTKPNRLLHQFVAVLVLLSALVAVSSTANAQADAPVEIDSGTLDHDRVDGQRWQRFYFDPLSSETQTIRISVDGDADVLFSVFEASSGTRVATTYRSATPLEWTGALDATEQHFVGIWAASGSADYTATIEPVITPRDDNDTAFTVARSWNARGEVHRVFTVGDTVYVGGDFTEIYGPTGDTLARTHLAAFNRFTGNPTSFAPVLDGDVRTFALSPDEATLYVGGTFKNADGERRQRIAAFDIQTGAMTDFNPPAPNRALRAIAVTDSTVYVGGPFTKIGARDRPYVAAFDPDTGALDSTFAPSPDDTVKALIAGPEGLWIGGDFSELNGTRQRGLGLVDLENGSLRPSDDVTAEVIDLAASDEQLFIAIGGPGGRAAAFDRATGTEQWTIASDGNFQGVDVDEGRYVYFGGHYEIVEGNRDADRLTRHDKLTGEMDVSWLPRINGIRSVNAVDVTSDGVYIGGDFSRVEGQQQEGFAIFSGRTE